MTRSGLLSLESRFDPRVTMDRLEQAVRARGMTVFARINFSQDAADAGMDLRPTELLLFGNPEAGTVLLQWDQHVGVDLPLKALVWCAHDKTTWIGFPDPRDFLSRYGLSETDTATKIRQALFQTTQEAAGEALFQRMV